jgi:hypothetical protein
VPLCAVAILTKLVIEFALIHEVSNEMRATRFGLPERLYFFYCPVLSHD